MRTSEHLAAAAGHLAALLRQGQHDLVTEPDLTLAVRSRDQAAAGLSQALRTVVNQLDAAGGHQDVVQAATPLAAALIARTSGLPGPAPGDVGVDRPSCRSAQAWGQAATEIEAAAGQRDRAGPARADDLRAAGVDLVALAGALADLDTDLAGALTAAGRSAPGHAADLAVAGRTLAGGTRVGVDRAVFGAADPTRSVGCWS
jgi:hypothetical protein